MALQDFCILTQILCSGCCITDTFRASPSTSNQILGIQPKAQRKHVQDQIRISFRTHQHKLHSKLHFHTCLTSHRCWSTNWALSGSFYPAFPVTAFLLCPFIAVLRVKLGEVFPGLVFNVFPGFTCLIAMFHHFECQTKFPNHKRFRVASVVQDVVCGSFSSTCPSATGMVTSQRSERLLSLHVWGSMCCFSNAETTWNNCHKRQIGVLGVVSPQFNWCTWYWQSLGHLSYLGSLSADGVMDSHGPMFF